MPGPLRIVGFEPIESDTPSSGSSTLTIVGFEPETDDTAAAPARTFTEPRMMASHAPTRPAVADAPGRAVSAPRVDEPAFQRWYATQARQWGLPANPDDASQFYDYRAAFRAGATPGPDGHWPSQFKKPGHPNEVVGGFNTRTGERVPNTPRADAATLERLGWEPDTAKRLAASAPTTGDILAKMTGLERGETLGERIAAFPGRALRAIPAGFIEQVGGGGWGLIRDAAKSLGLDEIVEFAKGAQDTAGALGRQIAGSRGGAGEYEQAVYSGLESIGGMAPSIAAGVATGGAAAPLAIMGAQTMGTAYGRAADAGLEHAQANLYAGLETVAEVGTELIPAGKLFKALNAKTPLRKMILEQLASEGLGEQAATLLQDANEWAFLNPSKTLWEFAQERPSRAVDTLISTVTATLGTTLGAAVVDRAARPPASADVVREGVGGVATREVVDEMKARATAEPGAPSPAAAPEPMRPAAAPAPATMADLVAPATEAAPTAPPQTLTERAAALVEAQPDITPEAFQAALELRTFGAAKNMLDALRARQAPASAPVEAAPATIDDAPSAEAVAPGAPTERGLTDDQVATLTALGYDPAAMTLVDAQEALRSGQEPAGPPMPSVGPDVMSDENLSAARRVVERDPDLRRRLAEMQGQDAAVKGAKMERPRGGAEPTPEGVSSDNTPAVAGDSGIEAATTSRVAADPDGYVDRYLAQFGRVLNADNASELFPEYAGSAETRATRVKPVRKAASTVVERAFTRLLAEPVPPGKDRLVVFTSGGNASGKSSTTNMQGRQALTWDTTASQLGPTAAKIDEALAAGFDVEINHVSLNPSQALTRAIIRAEGESQGRTVTVNGLASTHQGARDTLLALADRYRDNPRVNIAVFDNNGTEIAARDLDWLREQEYPTGDELRAELHALLDGALDEGAISPAVYRGFGGRRSAAPGEPSVRSSDRGRPAGPPRADGRADAEGPVGTDVAPSDPGTSPGTGAEGRQPGRGPARRRPTVRTRNGKPSTPGIDPAAHRRRLVDSLVDDARAAAPDVDVADLRDELAFRLDLYDELQAEARQNAYNPRKLLEVIAQNGGIAENDYRGYRGELARLKEGLKFGNLAGVPSVFRKRVLDDKGAPAKGLPLDVMLGRLQQHPEFQGIEDINTLVDMLDDIRIHGLNAADHLPGTNDVQRALDIEPGTRWWENRWRPQADEAPDAGDDTFDPVALERQAPKPFTAEALADVFDLPAEQASAVYALADAMGLPMEKIELVQGPPEDAAPTTLEQNNAQTVTERFRQWFRQSKVTNADGSPLVVYHGTRRLDRVGTRFLKSRATSGPMPFFTDDRELASKYAESKADTSLDAPEDYAAWFPVKIPGQRRTIDVSRAWYFLSSAQRQNIADTLPHVSHLDADGNEIDGYRLDPDDYGMAGKSHWEWTIREKRGNVLAAAVDIWLNSAGLFGNERDFMKILALGGMDADVTFDPPDADHAGVLPVFLSIQRPLDTSAVPADVVAALERASTRQRAPRRDTASGDFWDKRRQHPREWVQTLKADVASGANSHVWTSIPDWVTDTLTTLGYDGIRDRSGKNGGEEHDVWIPFEPTQIKSAIGNRGTFDRTSPNILFQGGGLFDEDETQADLLDTGEAQPRLPGDVGAVRNEERPTPKLSDIEDEFRLTPQYEKRRSKQITLFQAGDAQAVVPSGAWYFDNILHALPAWQVKGTPEQLLAHLKKTKGAMDEAADIGLAAWLEGKRSVTRDEVRAFVEAHKIDVQEVVRGDHFGPRVQAASARRRAARDAAMRVAMARDNFGHDQPEQFLSVLAASSDDFIKNTAAISDRLGAPLSESDRAALEEYREAAREVSDAEGSEPEPKRPKYEQYQLDGPKSGYREILLTLPAQRVWIDGSPVTAEDLSTAHGRDAADRVASYAENVYHSSHFDEPNILLHLRVNTRTLADGRRVLFAEEMQSDWHQEGRRKGYGQPTELPDGFDVMDHGARFSVRARGGAHWSAPQPTREEAIAEALRRIGRDTRVPDAPFKGDGWKKLALKRLLALAAEEGVDGLAWTTGDQQADRYDLSKQVRSIKWSHDGTEYALEIYTHDGQPIARHEDRDEGLVDIVGKEMADKIVAARAEGKTSGRFEGLDLKVGGEGMRGFYDRELVNLANDIAKKDGTRVEKGEIVGEKRTVPTSPPRVVEGRATVHVLPTPASMRERIKASGLALFQAAWHGSPQDAKASVEFSEGLPWLDSAKALIRALTKPDVSSPVHELAHVARRFLLNRDVPAAHRRGVSDEDIATTERWAGATDGVWDTAAEEKFARGFERFVREGGPTLPSNIREVFAKLADWLTDIYQTITGSAIDVEITPEMRAVFERLVTRKERLAAEAVAKAEAPKPSGPPRRGPITDHDEYIAFNLSQGRKAILRDLHRMGVKQGTAKATDEELAEMLWKATRPTAALGEKRQRTYSSFAAASEANKAAGGGFRVVSARTPGGPRSFYLKPLTAAVSDTLDTGEQQDRLPGDVGAVRDEERAQPTEDVPEQTLTLTSQQIEPTQAGLGLDPIARVESAAKQRLKDRGTSELFQRGDTTKPRYSARQNELEQMATDEAMGVEFPEDEPSFVTLNDGEELDAVICTNCATKILEMNGGKGDIYGWQENPTSIVAEGDGHDFAVIDGRYIVDPWAVNVEGSAPRAVFDLGDAVQRAEALRLYGDPKTWMKAKLLNLKPNGFSNGYPPILDTPARATARRNRTTLYQADEPLPLTADDQSDLVVIGAAKLARGLDRDAWTRAMMREFSPRVQPFLAQLYPEAKRRAEAAQDVTVDDYFNLKRIDVSDAEKAELTAAILETVYRTGRVPKERESWETIQAEAVQMAPEVLSQLAPFQQMQAPFRAVRLVARQRINALNDAIYRERLAMEGLPGDAPETLARERALAEKERDLQGLLNVWMRLRSEDGRNLAMHRMMVGSVDQWYQPAFWMSKARQELGLPVGTDLPIDVFRALQDILNRGRYAVENGQPVEPIQLELSRYLTRLRKSTWMEIVSAVRKAGLLTGPKTQARNILGNLAFATLEELSRVPAVVIDFAVGTLTGHRTVHGLSPRAVAEASRHAATKGLEQARDIFRTGSSADSLMKADASRELNSGMPWLDAYVNTVFRSMGATDRVFKSYAFRRSLEEQAALEAINRGVSPVELLAKPTAEMLARAVSDAEFATFNNPNTVAEFVTKGKAALKRLPGRSGKTTAFVIDMAVPFVNTPSNILARMLDYTPGGALLATGRATLAVADQAKKTGAWKTPTPAAIKATIDAAMTPEQQRLFAQGIARGATGSALIYLGWMLAAAGMATGMGDDDEGDRNVREAAGMLPGAVRIGDRWHQIATFSPAGNLVSLGATVQRTATKPLANELLRGTKLAAIAGRLALEQPMLKGMNDLIQSLQRPEAKAEAAAGAFAGSFVPTLVNDIASAFDPYRRENRPDGIKESLWSGVTSRLPGLRNQLPARLTVLGDTQTQDSRAIWDPTIGVVARDLRDDVLRELVARDVGLVWPRQTKDETADAYRRRIIETGQAIRKRLDRIIDAPVYQQASDERKTEMLQDAIEQARRTVRPKKAGAPMRRRFQ